MAKLRAAFMRHGLSVPYRVAYSFKKAVGRTKQSMRAECDINNIMKKYAKTGAIDHFSKHGAQYGFVSSMSLQESIHTVQRAQEMFMDLPASVRKKFDNDPALFLAFAQDRRNLDEMRELGLAPKLVAKAPTEPPKGPSSST